MHIIVIFDLIAMVHDDDTRTAGWSNSSEW